MIIIKSNVGDEIFSQFYSGTNRMHVNLGVISLASQSRLGVRTHRITYAFTEILNLFASVFVRTHRITHAANT